MAIQNPVLSFQRHPDYMTIPQMNRSRIEDMIQQIFQDNDLNLPLQIIQKRWVGPQGNSTVIRKIMILAFSNQPCTARKMPYTVSKIPADWRIQFGDKQASFRPYVHYGLKTRYLVIAEVSANLFKAISLEFRKTVAEIYTLEPEGMELKYSVEEPKIRLAPRLRHPPGVKWVEIVEKLKEHQLIRTRTTDHEYRDDPRVITWICDLDLGNNEYALDGIDRNEPMNSIKEHLLYLYQTYVSRGSKRRQSGEIKQ